MSSSVFEGYELADRYRSENGRVFLSGLQAVARLPIDQIRIDRAAGLNTAVFISGYQGSPVGTLKEEIDRAAAPCRTCRSSTTPGSMKRLRRQR